MLLQGSVPLRLQSNDITSQCNLHITRVYRYKITLQCGAQVSVGQGSGVLTRELIPGQTMRQLSDQNTAVGEISEMLFRYI